MAPDNESKAVVAPAPQRRIVMKRRQSMSYSTALFYLQSKPQIDDEYRRIMEAMLDGLMRHTGLAGHDLGDIELAPEESKQP